MTPASRRAPAGGGGRLEGDRAGLRDPFTSSKPLAASEFRRQLLPQHVLQDPRAAVDQEKGSQRGRSTSR